jgi:hypothetical protein
MPLIRTEIHVDVWVDTNVFLEIISWGDLYDAADVPDMARIEARRLRMQGSLWMAMALSQQGAATMSYSHETVRNMVRQSSIPERYAWAWAARVMTVDAARTMFLDRLRTALDAWAAEDGPGRPSAAQTILERYTWIWQPAAPSAAATSAEPPP